MALSGGATHIPVAGKPKDLLTTFVPAQEAAGNPGLGQIEQKKSS
jgi:hypothetical protein